VVVVTGPQDIVTDGKRVFLVKNGHALMANVVGTGCMAASAIGTFAAIEKDLAVAAAAGLSCFEIAGELSAKTAKGPGTFREKLFDCVYNLDKKAVSKMQKIEELKIKKGSA
jgi:hydroxyethylthiazole kinase